MRRSSPRRARNDRELPSRVDERQRDRSCGACRTRPHEPSDEPEGSSRSARRIRPPHPSLARIPRSHTRRRSTAPTSRQLHHRPVENPRRPRDHPTGARNRGTRLQDTTTRTSPDGVRQTAPRSPQLPTLTTTPKPTGRSASSPEQRAHCRDGERRPPVLLAHAEAQRPRSSWLSASSSVDVSAAS